MISGDEKVEKNEAKGSEPGLVQLDRKSLTKP